MPDAVSMMEPFEQDASQDEAINPVDVRLSAMNFLARREHSLRELRQKLQRRFRNETIVLAEIQRLVDENLQSDERYAQSYSRQRALKGYGPLRVRQEMREKGLSDQQITLAFEALELDWAVIANQAYSKKFGRRACADLKEKSRRSRFMQYRGFSSEHYQHLLEK